MDAEDAHHFTIKALKIAGKIPLALSLAAGGKVQDKRLERDMFGLHFKNPVGLAAGLDKNGEVIDEMGALGFGFVEIGTVTPRPQPGNDKPRLFRLVKDNALINRMGFNNVGANVAAYRLSKRKSNIIVGANIGKNKTTENEDAVKDYEMCFKVLFDEADYFVVNVSSPNTPGLRALQDKDSLYAILNSLQNINQGKNIPKPILLKIAPDLTWQQVDDVISVVQETKIQGVIATNTTIGREGLSYPKDEIEKIGMGGLSGAPLTKQATDIIQYINTQSRGTLPVIGVGGIMNAAQGLEKIKAGASLIQLYTGFIYKGPELIHSINRALLNT